MTDLGVLFIAIGIIVFVFCRTLEVNKPITRYVIFTQEELDAIKNGDDIKTTDHNGNLVVYTNDKKYAKTMMSMKEKEVDND